MPTPSSAVFDTLTKVGNNEAVKELFVYIARACGSTWYSTESCRFTRVTHNYCSTRSDLTPRIRTTHRTTTCQCASNMRLCRWCAQRISAISRHSGRLYATSAQRWQRRGEMKPDQVDAYLLQPCQQLCDTLLHLHFQFRSFEEAISMRCKQHIDESFNCFVNPILIKSAPFKLFARL